MKFLDWLLRRKPVPVPPVTISPEDAIIAYHFGYTDLAWRAETIQTKRKRREQFFHAKGL